MVHVGRVGKKKEINSEVAREREREAERDTERDRLEAKELALLLILI